jgi:hypothetical protein
MNYAEISEDTDPATGEVIQKNAFIIFAHGNEILLPKNSESRSHSLPIQKDEV